ncbi:hypothetical protein [Pseudomonas sp. WS 5079]|uniref:hypothetical protein n=1 Tax=Pseudomonas sp. WS 5079 TaxID=2717492 RepID=UPI001556CB7C|nr:hypothetical protein [Pseudomonas sp. WS 5079]NMX62866.1 hypothetical protein [Pseudomonas sp. WS 5079]
MPQEKNAFREAAIEAISDMAQHLPLDCELLVVACRPGKKDFDLVLPSPESNLNNALDALRRNGLSIDGDNAYKCDLLDCVVGALATGAQNSNPPPAGHWCQRFWDIGREERAMQDELLESLSNLVGLAKLGAARLDKYHAALAHAETVIAKATS